MKSASAALRRHKRVDREALCAEFLGWDAKPPVISSSKMLFVEKQQNTFSSIKLKMPQSINYAVSYCFAFVRCWAHSAPSWIKWVQHLFELLPCLFQCSPFWGLWFQQKALIYVPCSLASPYTLSLTRYSLSDPLHGWNGALKDSFTSWKWQFLWVSWMKCALFGCFQNMHNTSETFRGKQGSNV